MQSLRSYRENRPWGEFVQFTKNSPSTVKIITVKPHEATSLQKHNKRDEFWYIISGNGFITIGENKIEVQINSEYFVPRETCHRIEGGDTSLVLLEVSTGEFDENDIERIEDRYNRNTLK
jgi:mannose-6-phosphate isomerase